jgi:hypothetical protein
MFPVYSTSVKTKAIERVIRVLMRTPAAAFVDHAGVYNCRRISGSTVWSQHAWGNAVDLFPKTGTSRKRGYVDADEARQTIARTIVRNATRRTKANRGRKLKVSQVIDHDGRLIWTPERGWHPYTGTTGNHVHVSGAPLRAGTPPCAGG